MLEKISERISNIWFLWLFALTLNIITFLFVFYKMHPSAKPMALHYNVLVGVDSYGDGRLLYIIPGVGLLTIMVNYSLFRALRKENPFLSFLSSFVAAAIQVILLLAVLMLMKVN